MLKFKILLTVIGWSLVAGGPLELPTKLGSRIVDGQFTTITSFPYQVSIHVRGHLNCGGTIISNQIILTAAHCVEGWNTTQLKVRAGSSQWTSGGVLVDVKSFKVHEDYIVIWNDVAVIRLNTSLVFSSTIRPAKLAREEPKPGAVGVISGWGVTKSESDSLPTFLKYAQMKLLTNEECLNYGYKKILISEGVICSYVPGRDACQGDSGGPLFSNNTLVGVVSWGYGCARENYPAVYTSVAYFRKWILKAALQLLEAP